MNDRKKNVIVGVSWMGVAYALTWFWAFVLSHVALSDWFVAPVIVSSVITEFGSIAMGLYKIIPPDRK